VTSEDGLDPDERVTPKVILGMESDGRTLTTCPREARRVGMATCRISANRRRESASQKRAELRLFETSTMPTPTSAARLGRRSHAAICGLAF
jgi:hypothetical protein